MHGTPPDVTASPGTGSPGPACCPLPSPAAG
jgi:hypothetical protein